MSWTSERLAALAVATAIKKEAADLRAEVDAEAIEAFEADGTSQRAVMIGGRKVGTFSVAVSRPTVSFEVADGSAWWDWAERSGWPTEVDPALVDLDVVAREHPEWCRPAQPTAGMVEAVGSAVVSTETGEEIPGLVAVTIPGRVTTRMSGCKPADVRAALLTSGALPGPIAALLPGREA